MAKTPIATAKHGSDTSKLHQQAHNAYRPDFSNVTGGVSNTVAPPQPDPHRTMPLSPGTAMGLRERLQSGGQKAIQSDLEGFAKQGRDTTMTNYNMDGDYDNAPDAPPNMHMGKSDLPSTKRKHDSSTITGL